MPRIAKLNTEQCNRFIQMRQKGASMRSLQDRFKVSESTGYKILNGSYKPRNDQTLENGKQVQALFSKKVHTDPNILKAAEERLENIDPLTLAAAQLIVARANYQKSLQLVN